MIVQTDFMDHWKTQMLIEMLDDPASPLCLIRLWAHCQQRKEWRFDSSKLTPMILKAITRSCAAPQKLWDTLVEVGFLDIHDDGTVEAHGFHDANSQLIAKWVNGKKGGRPKKKAVTEKPKQNLKETEPEPIEEREGEEKKEKEEKQDEGEKGEITSVSPSPGNKYFWLGVDYSKVTKKTITDYEDLRTEKDPIIAAMRVTGDYNVQMYGFLIKKLQQGLQAGLSTEGMAHIIMGRCEKLLGEIKAGERACGGNAPKAFIAEIRECFTGI